MKLREFWIQDQPIAITVGEERISIYQAVDKKPSTVPKPFIHVREVSSALDATYAEVIDALEELMELMEAVREKDYEPDSFTNQPARLALAALKKARGE